VRASPVVVALDTPDLRTARAWAAATAGVTGMVKVGLQLWSAAGPGAVSALVGDGHRVMLDLKLHDIPTTVAGAVRAQAELGAELLTVHALGGRAMLAAAVEAAGPDGPRVAAVTVLTSLDDAALGELGLPGAELTVPRLAALAAAAGAGAVVCAPPEVGAVRAVVGEGTWIVCPGVRAAGEAMAAGDADDQRRVATPAGAIAAGADLLVVGRPVTGRPDARAAAAAIADEALAALAARDRGLPRGYLQGGA
jgi:orotidine-5'-phosphate decarboxylase